MADLTFNNGGHNQGILPQMDSVYQMEVTTKVHRSKIINYSLTNVVCHDSDMEVGTFDLDGHKWAMLHYPSGSNFTGRMSFSVMLLTETDVSLNVRLEFCLLDQTGASSPAVTKNGSFVFRRRREEHGFSAFMKINDLVASRFIRDDIVIVQCKMHLTKAVKIFPRDEVSFVVPPSDVTFHVGDAAFAAHKCVLAAQSGSFRDQLSAHASDSVIKICDVQPDVFKSILSFIYTDSLPQEVSSEMAEQLVAAADKFGLERLKLMCAEKLFARVDIETAFHLLALAEKHKCEQLKEFCYDCLKSYGLSW